MVPDVEDFFGFRFKTSFLTLSRDTDLKWKLSGIILGKASFIFLILSPSFFIYHNFFVQDWISPVVLIIGAFKFRFSVMFIKYLYINSATFSFISYNNIVFNTIITKTTDESQTSHRWLQMSHEQLQTSYRRPHTNYPKVFLNTFYKTLLSERIWFFKCSYEKRWFILKEGKV